VWPTARPSSRNKKSYRPVIIGVNAAKDTIYSRLSKEYPNGTVQGPGAMHFPVDRDLGYFSQLTAERSVLITKGGQRYRVWQQRSGRANEALDCRVYAYAALCGLMQMGLQLNRKAEEVVTTLGPPVTEQATGDAENASTTVAPPQGPTVTKQQPTGRSLASRLA
jgi:phage terminase large subunit GpA-like protein